MDDPEPGSVRFETSLSRAAGPPVDDGWRLFRDDRWHGELTDPDQLRTFAGDALGVQISSVGFGNCGPPARPSGRSGTQSARSSTFTTPSRSTLR
jgi:hypothetical protein